MLIATLACTSDMTGLHFTKGFNNKTRHQTITRRARAQVNCVAKETTSQACMFDTVPMGHPACMMMKEWFVSGAANGLT